MHLYTLIYVKASGGAVNICMNVRGQTDRLKTFSLPHLSPLVPSHTHTQTLTHSVVRLLSGDIQYARGICYTNIVSIPPFYL